MENISVLQEYLPLIVLLSFALHIVQYLYGNQIWKTQVSQKKSQEEVKKQLKTSVQEIEKIEKARRHLTEYLNVLYILKDTRKVSTGTNEAFSRNYLELINREDALYQTVIQIVDDFAQKKDDIKDSIHKIRGLDPAESSLADFFELRKQTSDIVNGLFKAKKQEIEGLLK